ncbi:hypothetical protein ACLOJK_000507 [Asimina triloba]
MCGAGLDDSFNQECGRLLLNMEPKAASTVAGSAEQEEPRTHRMILMLVIKKKTPPSTGLASMGILSHERTPMDEAVSQGKMGVVDAINTAVAQVELDGVRVS